MSSGDRDDKEAWRARLAAVGQGGGAPPGQGDWGRLAQALRQLPAYRAAGRFFVSPAPELAQIRINALVDGKELLLPAPGLKDGFYGCRPYSIPFRDLAFATSLRGLPRFGRLLDNRALAKGGPVGLLVAEAVAVDPFGTRLGNGNGFFDLACAILADVGVFQPAQAEVWAVVGEGQLVTTPLPVAPWDVALDGVITPESTRRFIQPARPAPTVHWADLPKTWRRRLNPLWQLSQAHRPSS